MKRIAMLTSQRSEEEKERRRKYGDKGARFKSGKLPKVDPGGVVGTITTMVTKDLRVIEYEEDGSWPVPCPGREGCDSQTEVQSVG